ncbi:uncharacterized protein PST29_1930 [Pseudomonas sp. St29]|nr:uncharacterized protein PST29_1930 [Pseudomonas sp. St29]
MPGSLITCGSTEGGWVVPGVSRGMIVSWDIGAGTVEYGEARTDAHKKPGTGPGFFANNNDQ